MSEAATDPFTQVFNRLWTILEERPGFGALVKPGNRIKYAGTNRTPHKQQMAAADAMELMIVPEQGGRPHLKRTSTSSTFTQVYAIKFRTGDLRVDHRLFPLKWELIKAFSQQPENLGLSFVVSHSLSDWLEDAFVDNEPRSVDEGWLAAAFVTVEFRFTRAHLETGP